VKSGSCFRPVPNQVKQRCQSFCFFEQFVECNYFYITQIRSIQFKRLAIDVIIQLFLIIANDDNSSRIEYIYLMTRSLGFFFDVPCQLPPVVQDLDS